MYETWKPCQSATLANQTLHIQKEHILIAIILNFDIRWYGRTENSDLVYNPMKTQ